jgi:hypothetical protein
MKQFTQKRNFFTVALMALLLAVIIPATGLGQGRGRGHSRGGIFGDSHNKCGKFVNCHDARDGRWDGRGPRADRFGNILRRNRRHHNRRFDDDWRSGRRHRHRNLVNNGFWRDRRFRNR